MLGSMQQQQVPDPVTSDIVSGHTRVGTPPPWRQAASDLAKARQRAAKDGLPTRARSALVKETACKLAYLYDHTARSHQPCMHTRQLRARPF